MVWKFVFIGHEFLQISYHMPTACEVCPKPLWHMFKPPAAYECKRYFNLLFKFNTSLKNNLLGAEIKYIKNMLTIMTRWPHVNYTTTHIVLGKCCYWLYQAKIKIGGYRDYRSEYKNVVTRPTQHQIVLIMSMVLGYHLGK